MKKSLSLLLATLALMSNTLAIGSSIDEHLPGLNFPVSYEGVLPCADCPGIATRINLWDDGVFHMQRTYLDTSDGDQTFFLLGRWHIDPVVKNKIYLHSDKQTPTIFIITEDGNLEKMDIHGNPIDSSLPYTLTPLVFTPMKIETGMTGEFRYMADAAQFTECHTQRSYPVAMQRDYLALEKAYSSIDNAASRDPIVVSIEAELSLHQSMEASQGEIETIFVNHFIGIPDGLTCQRALSDAKLVNTYWKIKSLNGHDIEPVKEGRQAHMILQDVGETKIIAATVGCNRMRGSYQLNGNQIEFDSKGMAMTLMACPPPLDELENTLADTLKKSKRWQIESQLLEFFDAQDRSVALFEAVYLP